METNYSNRWVMLAIVVTALSIQGCKNDPDAPEPRKGIQVQNHATFGQVLTDSVGMTLYVFARDANGTSACAGNCVSLWPSYYSSNAAASMGIDAEDIGTITLANGSKQTTYKGWPLYYYSNDQASGAVEGDGVGGNWFVAKPDYSVLLVSNQLVGGDGTHYTADLMPGEGQTQYLVDAYGRTLYGFVNDRYDTNKFTNPDFSNNGVWPIYESAIQAVPSTLSAEDFAEITVHGRMQLTYKGWPLYYFGQDAARGETKGIDFPALGIWPVLNADSPEAVAP
ncbi:hypothetical protein GCM10007415_02800 [Parapedobacter pyrenivorans]|uniref:Lipoprotein with Yx(FWY)xxD motif n=1 Tax=Parapedobacter pyrenivorans TaxID=1305674 RepID=A0A917HCB1_9SPHI|nr:hypothetical protein [Parapedobacter pyrenivorans]GGG74689.1 hypothetical protein GCM10007415_02800 [Parapedobacter pyrenivorans]